MEKPLPPPQQRNFQHWSSLTQAKGTSFFTKAWGALAACKHQSPRAGPRSIVIASHCFAKTFASSLQLSWAPLKLKARSQKLVAFSTHCCDYIHNRELQIRWGKGLIHFRRMALNLTRFSNSRLLFGWKQLIHPIFAFSAALPARLGVMGGVLALGYQPWDRSRFMPTSCCVHLFLWDWPGA